MCWLFLSNFYAISQYIFVVYNAENSANDGEVMDEGEHTTRQGESNDASYEQATGLRSDEEKISDEKLLFVDVKEEGRGKRWSKVGVLIAGVVIPIWLALCHLFKMLNMRPTEFSHSVAVAWSVLALLVFMLFFIAGVLLVAFALAAFWIWLLDIE